MPIKRNVRKTHRKRRQNNSNVGLPNSKINKEFFGPPAGLGASPTQIAENILSDPPLNPQAPNWQPPQRELTNAEVNMQFFGPSAELGASPTQVAKSVLEPKPLNPNAASWNMEHKRKRKARKTRRQRK